MRIIALIILIFGVAIAGGAVFFASERYTAMENYLKEQAALAQTQPAEPQIKTTSVVIATAELRYGAVLSPDAVRIVEFPEETVPENAFSSMEELFGGEDEDKRIVLRAIDPNEPVTRSKVTGFGERATISAQLSPGMRAFTLRIDTVSGVAGFLLPNDRVDIFLTRGDRNGLTSNVIMQNVKIIAVDQFSDKDSSQARVARTATVEVSASDAQKLALAQQVGRISLSLRQIDETGTVEEPDVVELSDIIEMEEEVVIEPAPVVERKQLCVRKGTERICN